MMRQYNHGTINKAQSVVAYLLLVSQLLTSCGGSIALLPKDLDFQPTKAVHKQSKVCTDDSQQQHPTSPTFPITATSIKGNELIFSYTSAEGLSASYKLLKLLDKDLKMEKMIKHLPILQYPILMDINGGRQSFNHFTQEEARFLAIEGKWEVSKAGELEYLGIRA